MYTHTHPKHAHLTHTTIHVQTVLQLHSESKTASFSKSLDDFVGDGRVALPLWLHAREAADLNKGTLFPGANPRRAALERGRQALHRAALPKRYARVRN